MYNRNESFQQNYLGIIIVNDLKNNGDGVKKKNSTKETSCGQKR
jgi:hypothetical protein